MTVWASDINLKRGFLRAWRNISGQTDRVADPFYKDINRDQIDQYQRYLDALFHAIDVDNYTRWAQTEAHDAERLSRDVRVIITICKEDAAAHGLAPIYLQTMIHQYFFADPLVREEYKKSWAETVVYNREKKRFIPTGREVQKLFGKPR